MSVGDLVRANAVDEGQERLALAPESRQRREHGHAHLLGDVIGGRQGTVACGHSGTAVANDNRMDTTQHALHSDSVTVDGPVDQVVKVARVGRVL